jgi:hypothetical protein
MAERTRRRIERHLTEARLPPGKTIDSFDFEAVPVVSKAQVMALAAGDAWLSQGNLLLFGPPGGGKSHLAAALGFALVENGWRVLFTRTTDLVQRLQVARRELTLQASADRGPARGNPAVASGGSSISAMAAPSPRSTSTAVSNAAPIAPQGRAIALEHRAWDARANALEVEPGKCGSIIGL